MQQLKDQNDWSFLMITILYNSEKLKLSPDATCTPVPSHEGGGEREKMKCPR
jgi:hypothetical protein